MAICQISTSSRVVTVLISQSLISVVMLHHMTSHYNIVLFSISFSLRGIRLDKITLHSIYVLSYSIASYRNISYSHYVISYHIPSLILSSLLPYSPSVCPSICTSVCLLGVKCICARREIPRLGYHSGYVISTCMHVLEQPQLKPEYA
jgi:hypothetical protein